MTGAGILVDAIEMRFVPEAHPLQFRRPPRSARVQTGNSFDEGRPVSAGPWRRWRAGKRTNRIGCLRHAVQPPLRRGRADPGHQLHHPESGDAVARILDKAQQSQHVLDVGRIQEFEPAELHERNVAAGEFHFERSAMVRGAKQDRLLFQLVPPSRFSNTRATM